MPIYVTSCAVARAATVILGVYVHVFRNALVQRVDRHVVVYPSDSLPFAHFTFASFFKTDINK